MSARLPKQDSLCRGPCATFPLFVLNELCSNPVGKMLLCRVITSMGAGSPHRQGIHPGAICSTRKDDLLTLLKDSLKEALTRIVIDVGTTGLSMSAPPGLGIQTTVYTNSANTTEKFRQTISSPQGTRRSSCALVSPSLSDWDRVQQNDPAVEKRFFCVRVRALNTMEKQKECLSLRALSCYNPYIKAVERTPSDLP